MLDIAIGTADSAILAYVIASVWFVANYFLQKAGLPDVSEVPVCFSYVSYIILYVVVIRLTKKGEIKNKFMGYVVPVLAIIGSLIIFTGTIGHPLFFLYLIVCACVIGGGYYFTHQMESKRKEAFAE